MKLNQISDNPGATKDRMRVGRGIGSGKGKTGGRGQKGQKSREGVSIAGFEGGQMPLHMRLPKRGFNNVGTTYEVINLSQLAAVEGDTLDRAALERAGLVRRKNRPLKLLARGEVTRAVTIHVDAASEAAIQAVQAAGGRVVLSGATESGSENAEQAG